MKVISLCAIALTSTTILGFAPVRAAEDSGARPEDATMSCQQIGTELAPYMQQMSPSITAFAQTGQQAADAGAAQVAAEAPVVAGLSAAAGAATAADAAGAPGATAAVSQAEQAEQQRVIAQSLPEAQRTQQTMNAQSQTVLSQAQALQSNPRVMRLMQLAQEKNCH
jgi:hypothetical protein